MSDKPPTTDPEQREHDTAKSRHQSGLPPEPQKPQEQQKRPRDEQKKETSEK